MKLAMIPRLCDTWVNFSARMKISLRLKNRGQRCINTDQQNEYRATIGNRDELAPGWKSLRYHVDNNLSTARVAHKV